MSNQPGGNWWSRNWKWFVPVGCLGTLLIGVLFVGGIVFVVMGALKSSDACQGAFARAQSSATVQAAIGTPMEMGWFVGGNVSVSGGGGAANLSIPLSGPKGKARLFAEAKRSAGEWKYTVLVVEVAATHERLDLLP